MTPNGTSSPSDPQVQSAALNLRPLPLGELLDRAFHLYFANVTTFTALLAVVLVPLVVVSYFETRGVLDFYFSLIRHLIASPHSSPDLSALTQMMPSDSLVGLQWAITVLAMPLAYASVTVAVSRAYLGLPVTFAESYRQALQRWLPILILIIVWLVLIFGAIIVLAIGAAILIPSFLLIGRALGNGPFIGVTLAAMMIVTFIAAFCLGVMLQLTSAVSLIGVVLEKVDPIAALGNAFRRVFGSGQFWRGFVLAIALTAIYFGSSLVIGGGGAVLAYFLKAPALYIISSEIVPLFFLPFAVVTAAVYYYDLRIRREGYDLQMLIDRFSSTPATPSA